MGYKRTIPVSLECPFKPAQQCRTCDCRKRCFFNFLSPGAARRFRAERRMRRYQAHQFIFSEGEQPQGIHILCVGDAKLTKSNARGQELILQYFSCGDLLGEVSFLAGGQYYASAETLRESVVCFLPRNLVEHLYATEPEFSRKLLRKVSRTLCRTIDRAFGFAFRSAEARMAQFIAALKTPAVKPVDSCHVHARYSRREIAENLGLSPETVIRVLSSFQKRGLIRLTGKAIEVRDRTSLESVAAGR